VTAGYQLGWRKDAAPLRVEGAATEDPPPSHRGRKKTAEEGFASSVFPYPPLPHSLFVALFSAVSVVFQLWDRIEFKCILTLK